ncbi:hypothetical protein [Streptomyces lydicus]|uniref:hypothetical protein n=1 Tax=Streptomyces lydicus TaxID=47763 RepID=UPI0037875A9B
MPHGGTKAIDGVVHVIDDSMTVFVAMIGYRYGRGMAAAGSCESGMRSGEAGTVQSTHQVYADQQQQTE